MTALSQNEQTESGWNYRSLDQALEDVSRRLEELMTGKDTDHILILERQTSRKKDEEDEVNTELIRIVMTRTQGKPVYEGMIYLNQCDDFEKMILVGSDGASRIGEYSILIETQNQKMSCFYPALDELLAAISQMHDQPQLLHGRSLVLTHRQENRKNPVIGELYYSLNPNGTLRLESYLSTQAQTEDEKKVLAFIHDEQKQERIADLKLSERKQ